MKTCSNKYRLPLNLLFALSGLLPTAGFAAQVTLGMLDREYTGAAIVPSVTTDPEVLPVTLLYRKISPAPPAALSETIFNNIPPNPPLSYASLNFSGHRVTGLGDYIKLGKDARKLESCEIQLVTWAKKADYPAEAALDPNGYVQPVTLSLYTLSPDLTFTLLTDQTRNIFIPWRPLTLSNGSPYPFNGYAVTARFEFPDGITLPEQVVVVVDYNTSVSGFSPTGITGPADVLNLALDGYPPSVGADLDADVVLRITPEAWYYPNSGYRSFSGPITKLTASHAVTKIAPTEPGTYEVTAIAGASGTEGKATGTLTITQSSPLLTFESWKLQQFTARKIRAGAGAWDADPDGDGINNFVEFATGRNPNLPDTALGVEVLPGGEVITLVHPLGVGGIRYLAEESLDLAIWNPVPIVEIATEPSHRTIAAKASTQLLERGRAFLRFRFEPQ